MTYESFWLVFGLTGQLLFTGRFLVQWIASERQGRSVVPPAFWYLSVTGGLVLFTYALVRRDPVFIIGQSAGLAIYIRNLHLLHRTTQAEVSAAASSDSRDAIPIHTANTEPVVNNAAAASATVSTTSTLRRAA